MQIIAKSTLRKFWEREPRAEVPLTTWYRTVSRANWSGPADVKAVFGSTVDFVGDSRVIFDIGGNKYRLIVHFAYSYNRALIKFVGTHKEYDKINPEAPVMDIRPIRTQEDLDWALAEIEPYFDAPPAHGTPEADRFDVLADLIEAYEDRHFPIREVEPIEFLRAHMELTGRSQADLAKLLGSRSRASEVLNRRRSLTVEMVYKLNREWGIPADALVAPYHLAA